MATKKVRYTTDPEKFASIRRVATNRIALAAIGLIAERFNKLASATSKKIKGGAGDDGVFDRLEADALSKWFRSELSQTMGAVDKIIRNGWREAGLVGLSQIGFDHQRFFAPTTISQAKMSQAQRDAIAESVTKKNILVTAAAQDRFYSSGGQRWDYSRRIWNLENTARNRFDAKMIDAISKGRSAVEVANEIEVFLGAGADCPRWTYERLNPAPGTIPKGERPTKTRDGLISGSPCADVSKSDTIAYNALRLARTEIAWASAEASRIGWQESPFITGVNVVLSNTHPKSDICDEVVANNPHPLNAGLSPSGASHVPIHPNCLCVEVAVQPSLDDVVSRVSNWTNGGRDSGLDRYASSLGLLPGVISDIATAGEIFDIAVRPLTEWMTAPAKLLLDKLY
jgi:hypothetical protein